MRKLLLPILLFMLFASPAFAIERVITLLSAATTTGAGDSQWVRDTTVNNWTCDIDITGAPSAVTIRIEGNMGGDIFDPTGMATHVFTATQLSAGKATFGIVYSPVINIRAFVTVLAGGTIPTVTAVCGGNPI